MRHSFWWTYAGCGQSQRIQYKLCVLMNGCLNGTALRYLDIHERGTVYASPSLNLQIVPFLQKKNLNRFFSDFHFVCDNVYIGCVKRSSNSSYRYIALNKLS